MEELKCMLLSERNHPEKTTYYDSSYMIFWKKQNNEDSQKISGCQRLGGREG